MNCVFCKIVGFDNSLKNKTWIGENKRCVAFLDINPISDGHFLVISKKHYSNIVSVDNETLKYSFSLAKKTVKKLSRILSPKGFNFVSNVGKVASQEIFHFHLHVIPKYEKSEGFIWNYKTSSKKKVDEIFLEMKKNNN
jgi:histidine triad (HIT) family protein